MTKQGEQVTVSHRFLDEAGDTSFFGKGKTLIIGTKGVSLAFGIGMVKIGDDLAKVRKGVVALQESVETDPYLNVIPSVAKRISKKSFFFHASVDPPEVRERMNRFIRDLNCSLEMVVARKDPERFVKKHNGKDAEFYADVLSHLLKNKLQVGHKLVLNVAERGTSTRNVNLERALAMAGHRFAKKHDMEAISCQVVFNVQTPITEPLLSIPDYLCWAVQRVFEQGETRHYDYLRERISLVVDLYDEAKYARSRNYYRRDNPLTAGNKLSPPSP